MKITALTILLRLEGALIFITATFAYFNNGFHWLVFVLMFLAFDISMVGYLVNKRVGAVIYNFVHSFILPSVFLILWLVNGSSVLLAVVCAWFAHIGLDRALGYGLKLPTGFKHTHLGDIGR